MYMSKERARDIKHLALRSKVASRKASESKKGSAEQLDYSAVAAHSERAMNILLGLDTDGVLLADLRESAQLAERLYNPFKDDSYYIYHAYIKKHIKDT